MSERPGAILGTYPIELWHDELVRDELIWPPLLERANEMAAAEGYGPVCETRRDLVFFRIEEYVAGEPGEVQCPEADAAWSRWRYLRRSRRPSSVHARLSFTAKEAR